MSMTILILLKKAFLFLGYDHKFIEKINLFHLKVEIYPALANPFWKTEKTRQYWIHTACSAFWLSSCFIIINSLSISAPILIK